MDTTEDVFKADTLLSDQKMVDATDQLIDPFEIVSDQHKDNDHNAMHPTK